MNLATRIKQALTWRIASLRNKIILARALINRQRLKNTVFVGITGSAGKTTTKDLALAVLSRGGATTGNAASLNYLLDVAGVLLNTKPSDRFSVIEMDVGQPGSIDSMIKLTKPTIAALTVIQRDHIKSFASIEAIAKEKGKLIDSLPLDGTAVLNMDDPLVRGIGEKCRSHRIWFGVSPDADIRLIRAESIYPQPLTLEIEYEGRNYTCITPLHGTHLAVPVLASIGLGLAAGISIEECVNALTEVKATPGRMQIVSNSDGVTFLRDDYKAPYWSFQSALDYLELARAKRKVAVIGTLSDYSLSASKLYPKVARKAIAAADLVVFVGPHALRALKARQNKEDSSLVGFTEIEDAHQFLQNELREGDLVLLKGSNRADHLFRLILARSRTVTCWVRGCGLNRFCDVCPRLDAHGGQSAVQTEAIEGINVPVKGVTSYPKAAPFDADNTWLVIGMGNHGEAFTDTPHNLGFAAVDRLARELGFKWLDEVDGMVARGNKDECEVVLLKPKTLINLCGPAVERIRNRYGLDTDRLIVVHDDADLALADARFKQRGSDGGHKGLRSLFSALGNEGFMPRVRIGIRQQEGAGGKVKSIVLERFTPEQAAEVQAGLSKAVKLLQDSI